MTVVREPHFGALLCAAALSTGSPPPPELGMQDGYAACVLAMAYVVAIACCLHAWRRDAADTAALARDRPDERRARAPWFWLATAALLALCAISKPLDLHEFIADIGRWIARAGGWYEDRRRVQAVLAVAGGAVSLLALAVVGWRVRRAPGRYGIALAGLWLITLYAGLRVVSLHPLDAWLATRLPRGIRLHGIVEAFALVLIAAGAALSGWTRRGSA
jgi:hypothetical protein